MNIHDATEQAYKNGYEAGYKAGQKEMSAKELIEIVNDIFNDKFGEGGESFLTLPSGKRIDCDTGYAYEFWQQFIWDMKGG